MLQDLYLYLLQLVQALKYENVEQIKEHGMTDAEDLLLSTQSGTIDSSILHELAESKVVSPMEEVESTVPQLTKTQSESGATSTIGQPKLTSRTAVERPDLASFLIERACENTTLANYFFWYNYLY